jgi:Glutamine cyclotransferase
VFGEGLTIFADRIFQLTWKNRLLFEYEIDTFEPRPREIAIDGWGLTNDGRRLIASDGSDTLYFLNPDTLATLRTMKVKRKAWGLLRSQAMVNEMEMVGQKILGNIYRSNEIVQIDLETGCVDGVADFSRLYDELDTEQKHQVDSHSNNVLNGIAYSKKRGTFFLTGKRWPIIFEVRMDISPPAPTDQVTLGRIIGRGADLSWRLISGQAPKAQASELPREIHEALGDLSRRPKLNVSGAIQPAMASFFRRPACGSHGAVARRSDGHHVR